MIFVKIDLKLLSKLGKDYKWEKLRCCTCNCYTWGHGCVLRYFDDYMEGLYFKRYRCPKCRKVFTTRPDDYWARVRSSIPVVFSTLKYRLKNFLWPPEFPRQRGWYWLTKLNIFQRMHKPSEPPMEVLSFLETESQYFFA